MTPGTRSPDLSLAAYAGSVPATARGLAMWLESGIVDLAAGTDATEYRR